MGNHGWSPVIIALRDRTAVAVANQGIEIPPVASLGSRRETAAPQM